MKKLILMLAGLVFLSACAGTGFVNDDIKKPKLTLSTGTKAPKWFMDYPKDGKGTIYAVATGQSDDLQLAIDKAMLDAKVLLADKMQNRVNAEIKTVITDNGVGGISTDVQQQTTKIEQSVIDKNDISGYVVINSIVVTEGTGYRSFILLSYDTENWSAPIQSVKVDLSGITSTVVE